MNDKIIFFDGVCNFCNASINFVLKYDKKNTFKFCPLQSPSARLYLKNNENVFLNPHTFILLYNNKIFTKSTAALKVCRHLTAPLNILYIFILIPPFIRNLFYSAIAKYRYKLFGKSDTCRIPSPSEISRFISYDN